MKTKNKQNTSPLVTVIICVYNAGEYLRPSVESIIKQTYSNLEILIIDDGSTDGCLSTLESVQDKRLRIIKQNNMKKSKALNRALEEMTGEYFAIHDADDISYPKRIEKQVHCMMERPDVGGVFTGYDVIVNGRSIAPVFKARDTEECEDIVIRQLRMPSHDPTAMYRFSMLGDQRFDPKLPIGQGIDFILRAGEKYPLIVIGECLYSYRIHMKSQTKRDPRQRHEMVKQVHVAALRRRGRHTEAEDAESQPIRSLTSNSEKDNNLASHFVGSVKDCKDAGLYREAFRSALFCLSLHPFDVQYHKPFLYAILPISVRKFLTKKWEKRGETSQ